MEKVKWFDNLTVEEGTRYIECLSLGRFKVLISYHPV